MSDERKRYSRVLKFLLILEIFDLSILCDFDNVFKYNQELLNLSAFFAFGIGVFTLYCLWGYLETSPKKKGKNK